MNDDDHVCLCFRVTKRKIVNFCRRERPAKASQISSCLAAGTGCGWCVPFLQRLHEQVVIEGKEAGKLDLDPTAYAEARRAYRKRSAKPPPDPESGGGSG